MNVNWIIFTDLDGTLLDAQTYSFKNALPAIKYLKLHDIPVIPCTSKTYLEVINLLRKLGLSNPFIVENGSAIFIPKNYFPNISCNQTIDDYEVIISGKTHGKILECFEQMRKIFKLNIRGFTEMTVDEIIKLTQLPPGEAAYAKKRFFSEPMVSNENLAENTKLLNYLAHHGCRLLQGNRFYHLLGNTDKGTAARKLTALYHDHGLKKIRTMGLGDSKNDFDLLKVVEQPVLVRKNDGSYAPFPDLNHVYITENPGPTGWMEAIEHFISKRKLPS